MQLTVNNTAGMIPGHSSHGRVKEAELLSSGLSGVFRIRLVCVAGAPLCSVVLPPVSISTQRCSFSGWYLPSLHHAGTNAVTRGMHNASW